MATAKNPDLKCDECEQKIGPEKYYFFKEVPYNSDKIPDGAECNLCISCTATKLYEVYRTMEELIGSQ